MVGRQRCRGIHNIVVMWDCASNALGHSASDVPSGAPSLFRACLHSVTLSASCRRGTACNCPDMSAQTHVYRQPCSRAVKRNKDDNNDNFMTFITHLQIEHCISAAKSSIEMGRWPHPAARSGDIYLQKKKKPPGLSPSLDGLLPDPKQPGFPSLPPRGLPASSFVCFACTQCSCRCAHVDHTPARAGRA